MADIAPQEKEHEQKTSQGNKKSDDNASIGILDALRIVAGLLLINCIASYFVTGDSVTWNYRPWWIRPNALRAWLRSPVILTDEQLLQYDGSNESLPIYLALNGTIYDVSAGRRIYAPGGPYNVFAGHDATLAYITGCFKDDSIPDYRGAEWTFVPTDVPRFEDEPDEALSEAKRNYRYEMVGQGLEDVDKAIKHWAEMFRGDGGKEYFEAGRVDRDPKAFEKLPLRPLCPSAEKKRPKPKFDETVKYGGTAKARRAKRAQLKHARLMKSVSEEKVEKVADAGTGSKGHDEI